MVKIVTPDISPEDIAEFTNQLRALTALKKINREIEDLLTEAQSGKVSQEELIAALLTLEAS